MREVKKWQIFNREAMIISTGKSSIRSAKKEDVQECLKKIRASIESGHFLISTWREKNKNFFKNYNYTEEQAVDLCRKLTYRDFSKTDLSNNKYNRDHLLWFFGKKEKIMKIVDDGDDEEMIELYLKFDLKDDGNIVCVSFHKANHPIRYRFR